MSFWSVKKVKDSGNGRSVSSAPARQGWKTVGNVLLVIGVWLGSVLFINLGGPQLHAGLADGQRAPATVLASVDFDCVNIAATELLRRQAADAVVPVLSIQTGPLQAAWRIMEKLADRAVAMRSELDKAPSQVPPGSVPDAAAVKSLESGLAIAADLLGVPMSGAALASLFPAAREMEALAALKESLFGVWTNGIVSDLDRESRFQGLLSGPVFDLLVSQEGDDSRFRTVQIDDLASVNLAVETFVEDAQGRLSALDITLAEDTLAELGRASIRPNLDYNTRRTEGRRTAAWRAVEPVDMTVRKGTTIMEEGATVTVQTVEMMDAYNRRLAELESPRSRLMKRLGDAVLLLFVLAMCSGWLHSLQPGAYTKSRRKWLVVTLAIFAVALASLYRYLSAGLNWIPSWLAPFAIPISLTTMLAVLVLGAAPALVIGLWSGLASALIFGRSFELLLLGLGGAVLVVVMMRRVRKRSQVMRAGLAVGLLKGALALSMAAMNQHQPGIFLTQAGTAVLSGVLAALLALLLLPLVEWLFQHVTNISLLELTDMSHPLLQRLALEAPGTYHHSLMVGAIGQAAANRIGANGLLVSVCAYFHDIGKLAKPEFFSENQHGGENPHDGLAPSMSALVIQSHVKEGITLAKRYKLPRTVCNGIRTHHGTTLTSYFYQVARQALKEAGMAEDSGLEHSFRYDGPKPWTREQAILMLADTVEAASRSLDKPTPNRIAEQVESLMREKLLDGQLDLCPLTLEDLHEIQNSFVFALANILHGRNPYPREDQPAQPATGAGAASKGVPASGPDAGPAGISG